jgi:hypothetical protein
MRSVAELFPLTNMVTNELQVALDCDCGRPIAARAKDAGTTIACTCGNLVAVPKLSELRLLAGADAFVTNPAEAILKLQREGNEPGGDKCVMCGSATPVFYQCLAICEQSHVKKNRASQSNGLLRWLFLPFIVNVLISMRAEDETIDRHGHDLEVKFRLPLCDLCKTAAGNPTRPNLAKKLMVRVPQYKQLLDYYPGLSLTIIRP